MRSLRLATGILLASPAASDLLSDPYDYANATYWEERYKKQSGSNFEWYGLRWPILNQTLREYITTSSRVLHLGTGNSNWPQDMHADGFRSQLAIDISPFVIAEMQKRHAGLAPEVEFRVGDAMRTGLEDASFDVVMEKGTMEAVGSNRDCSIHDKGCELTLEEKSVVLEAFRVLRPGGLFVAVADELAAFKELEGRGRLDRIERKRIKESDGIPVPKNLWLCFKKGDEKSGQEL